MAADVGQGLTDQQRKAITVRDVSVALSAGAGCGKTFVLTERFLTQMEPKRDTRPKLSELVAITFTERAAREMRQRIRETCRQRQRNAPQPEADYWQGLIRQLDLARISTIHSFCASLLRAHAAEAGLDPRFQVLEQAQAETLLYEIIDDELRSRLTQQDDSVIDLIVQFGLATLRDMITALLRKRQLIRWQEWECVTADDLVKRWETYQRRVTLPMTLERIAKAPQTEALLATVRSHRPEHPEMQARCDELATRLSTLMESTDAEGDLTAIYGSARVQGGGGKKAWPSEDVYREFREAATQLRKLIDDSRPKLSVETDAARSAAEAGLQLLAVTRNVADVYRARKQELAALDFDDLLIHARDLLTSPDRQELRDRISAHTALLLVDEFQDTDPVQVELVEALAGEGLKQGRLFFVGDFKQSIYRFRGADPRVFERLREKMPADGRLPLTLNFRSQPAVLNFVNALFCRELGPGYEPLRPFHAQVAPEPAVELLWAPDETPEIRSGQSDRLRQREADWLARRLRAMLDEGEQLVWDEEAARAGTPAARSVRPGDIALLFRALSDVQYYEAALQRYGIEYYLVGGHAFYAQQEVFDLLNLLRALASPCDEVSLAGVLRSPMFNLEDETLFWLARHADGLNGGLFDSPPKELAAAQRGRVQFAASVLSELRAIKDRVSVAELMRHALERTGYDAVLLAEFLGERKLANLRKLIDQARGFDRSGILSLADFITQLSEFVARQPDEPLAATSPESADVVRLMTVHQSKGLEFPVVVVPDLDRRTVGTRASAAFTPELGPLVRTSTRGGGFDLYAAVEKEEDRAEMVRLLYVAATRAADYLILSSGVPELGSTRGPWTELLGRRFDLVTGQTLAQLPDGYPEPKVKVTISEPPLTGTASKRQRRRDLKKLVDKAVQLAEKGAGSIPSHLGPVEPDRSARRGYSFSRLSGELHELSPVIESEESTAGPSQLDPLGLGTLVHAALAEVDLAAPGDVPGLVRRLAPRHLPDAQDELDEPIDMIRRFLDSPRASQITAGREVHPELEFLLAWPPSDSPVESPSMYVEGFIDCLYQDERGAWHLLDYKTNRVTGESIQDVAAHYEMQMLLYALAVEHILGQSPTSLVLHFLRPGQEHQFSWDPDARGRVVRMIDQAIEALVVNTR
jgi:ATP-dependent helicase/nuclease subunit A